MMILEKLAIIELEVKNNIYKEKNILDAIESIRKILHQIDFVTELVPIDDIERLSKLLNSLKGNALNEEEIELLKRIIKRR